jgi:hypothetical protein
VVRRPEILDRVEELQLAGGDAHRAWDHMIHTVRAVMSTERADRGRRKHGRACAAEWAAVPSSFLSGHVTMVLVAGLEVVRLLRLPGDHRALVSAATAELAERMGEVKWLDRPRDEDRQAMRPASRVPESVMGPSPRVLGELG